MTVVTSTPLDLGRPIAGDVVELILEDHRRFEGLLRQLRDSTSDRDAVRYALSALHVAHAEAEEKYVYPTLRKKRAITEHEADHGEEEHAEGNQALLAVLELKGTDSEAFDDAVEELATALNHHLTEEELTILNPAREEVSEAARAKLGPGLPHRAQRAAGRRLRPDRRTSGPSWSGTRRRACSTRRARGQRRGVTALSPCRSKGRLRRAQPASPAVPGALLRFSHGAVGTLRSAEPAG